MLPGRHAQRMEEAIAAQQRQYLAILKLRLPATTGGFVDHHPCCVVGHHRQLDASRLLVQHLHRGLAGILFGTVAAGGRRQP